MGAAPYQPGTQRKAAILPHHGEIADRPPVPELIGRPVGKTPSRECHIINLMARFNTNRSADRAAVSSGDDMIPLQTPQAHSGIHAPTFTPRAAENG